MSIIRLMSSHEFFRAISPHFANLPQHITKMQINLDFASTDPVTVTAEFFCDIAENGDFISDKQETAVFELVRKE
jgi:hypothetical protein